MYSDRTKWVPPPPQKKKKKKKYEWCLGQDAEYCIKYSTDLGLGYCVANAVNFESLALECFLILNIF